MAKREATIEPTRIRVTASEQCRPLLKSGGALDRGGRFLDGLMRDLELPLRPQLEFDEASPPLKGADLRISFHGERVTLWSVANADADTVAQALSECLFRCRSLFVDTGVARRIWAGWFHDREADFDQADFAGPFRDLCAELAARGLKPGRAKQDFETPAPGPTQGDAFRSIFERVLARAGNVCVTLHLSPEQHARCFEGGQPRALPDDDGQPFQTLLDLMADELFYETGLAYRMDDAQIDGKLQAPWFRTQWNDVFAPPVKGLDPNEFIVNDTTERLKLFLEVEARAAVNPVNQAEYAIIQRDARKVCEEHYLTTWSAEGYVALHAKSEIRRNAGAFVTSHLTAAYQAKLSEAFPDLVLEAGRRFGREPLTAVLRLMLDEEIPIRDLRGIMDALLAINAVTTADVGALIVFAPNTGIQCPIRPGQTLADLTPRDYCDCVRMAMRRYISYKYTRDENKLVVYHMALATEERLRKGPLSPSERDGLLDAIGEEIGQLPLTSQNPVILTTYDVRRPLRELIAYDFPQTAVLSYQEMSPDINIQSIAGIEMPPEAAGDGDGAKKGSIWHTFCDMSLRLLRGHGRP